MTGVGRRTDEELLRASHRDADAFAAFYRRHARPITGYFLRRTGRPELAADLTAETFAAALRQCRRFDPERGAAVAWLYGIAGRELAVALDRGRAEDRARRRLRIPRMELDDEALEQVEASLSATPAAALLQALPPEQRAAVEARVVEEQDYAEIAASAAVSEAVVRQRVSRGLARLRSRYEEEQA